MQEAQPRSKAGAGDSKEQPAKAKPQAAEPTAQLPTPVRSQGRVPPGGQTSFVLG
jgi:hypothetical protein